MAIRVALVLGGAGCLVADLDAALTLGEYAGVTTCNEAGMYWPGLLDGWCSLHGEKLVRWAAKRRAAGKSDARLTATHDRNTDEVVNRAGIAKVDYRFPGMKSSGSSGLFALKLALVDCGFDRAVLCGIPMDRQPHFFDGEPWGAAVAHKSGWDDAMVHIAGRTRSMSGKTREWLGAPTEAWLNGDA